MHCPVHLISPNFTSTARRFMRLLRLRVDTMYGEILENITYLTGINVLLHLGHGLLEMA